MTARLHAWVRRWWRGEAGVTGAVLTVLTTPLTWLWRVGVTLDQWRWREGGLEVPGLRVVSVGNLSVGGTGKTPVAAWTCRLLADAGRDPALVARGYGSDELRLHRRWNPAVPVVADADRVAAAGRARDRGARTAVLDDGFQHRRLAREVDLVLLAAEEPFPARLLPRGPWREPAEALERAHAVVVTRRTAPEARAREVAEAVVRRVPGIPVGRVALEARRWATLEGETAGAPEGPLLVATGVARPDAVVAQVEAAAGDSAELLAFPDHHDFDADDVRRIRRVAGSRTVATTEKDAVKLAELSELLGPCRVLVQDLRWEEGEAEIRNLILTPDEEGRG